MFDRLINLLYKYIISDISSISIKYLLVSLLIVVICFNLLLFFKNKQMEATVSYIPIGGLVVFIMARYIGNAIRFFDPVIGVYIKHVATIVCICLVIVCFFYYVIKCAETVWLRLFILSMGMAGLFIILGIDLIRNIFVYICIVLILVKMVNIFRNK